MKRARKSNRVSWATGANLHQVKLFLSEDCPSKVGQKSHDHLQAKTSLILHSIDNESNDLPPGFEGHYFLNQSKVEFSPISPIKWECPPQFIFSYHWHVAAGEESKEKKDQKLREMRVLEAVYPRLSAIPPSPSVSLDVEEEEYDDNLTPLIPLIPIEEEESMDNLLELAVEVDAHTNVQSQNLQQYTLATTPVSSDSSTSHTVSSLASAMPLAGISLGMEADLAAASAVVAAMQGTLVDMDLLVRLLNDPIMIERLISEHRTTATTVSASMGIPTSVLKPSVPLSTPPFDAAASQITPTSTMSFGLRPATLPVSFLKPTPDKDATMLVPTMSSLSQLTSTHDKLATPSLSHPTPPPPHMHRAVKNIHVHMSNGMLPALNAQPPYQDTVLASGVKRVAPLASLTFNELSSVPLPFANSHSVVNQVQSTTSTMPYQLSTGSTSAVKDANYYKNLIRQHGADKQDKEDSQIGIPHSNFQDLKPVHNNPAEVRHKIQKPCIFFKSSRGCRNGSKCPYQHDMSVQWGVGNVLGGRSAKRLKLGPEI